MKIIVESEDSKVLKAECEIGPNADGFDYMNAFVRMLGFEGFPFDEIVKVMKSFAEVKDEYYYSK